MSFLDDLVDEIGVADKLGSIDIPGTDKTIYYKPLTLGERQKINREKTAEAKCIATIVMKSMDALGAQLFTLEDKVRLKTLLPSSVLEMIALEILGDFDDRFEVAEKN